MTTREYYDMTNVGLFRERVSQSSEVQYTKDGSLNEIKQKQEAMTLDAVDSVTLKDDVTSQTGTTTSDAEDVITELSNQGNASKVMEFTVPQGIK